MSLQRLFREFFTQKSPRIDTSIVLSGFYNDNKSNIVYLGELWNYMRPS